MKLKRGVILVGLQIEMREVLQTADDLWNIQGKELVVTCGLNGVHSAGSLHYYGYALDFRTRYFTAVQKALLQQKLQTKLGSEYDVVAEKTHIHVEYERAKTFG